jgi:hypothetical protein
LVAERSGDTDDGLGKADPGSEKISLPLATTSKSRQPRERSPHCPKKSASSARRHRSYLLSRADPQRNTKILDAGNFVLRRLQGGKIKPLKKKIVLSDNYDRICGVAHRFAETLNMANIGPGERVRNCMIKLKRRNLRKCSFYFLGSAIHESTYIHGVSKTDIV